MYTDSFHPVKYKSYLMVQVVLIKQCHHIQVFFFFVVIVVVVGGGVVVKVRGQATQLFNTLVIQQRISLIRVSNP